MLSACLFFIHVCLKKFRVFARNEIMEKQSEVLVIFSLIEEAAGK